MGPAIEKARAAQVAAMIVRIFMGFLLLPIGGSSFFIVSSRPCRPADYGHRTGQSGGMKSTWGPGSIMNTVSVARTHATAATAIAMWNPENSWGPPCWRTPPSRAMAKRDPARETALLTPDAIPARSDSTEVRTRVVNGAIARLMPSDSNRMEGKMSAQ